MENRELVTIIKEAKRIGYIEDDEVDRYLELFRKQRLVTEEEMKAFAIAREKAMQAAQQITPETDTT